MHPAEGNSTGASGNGVHTNLNGAVSQIAGRFHQSGLNRFHLEPTIWKNWGFFHRILLGAGLCETSLSQGGGHFKPTLPADFLRLLIFFSTHITSMAHVTSGFIQRR
jgi:hypothetical protein